MRFALAACLAVGCGRSQGVSDRDLGGLVVAEKPTASTIDVDQASTDPDTLGNALLRPHREIFAALGPHSVSIVMTTRVSESSKTVSELDEKTLIERADHGAVYAVYTNSQEYGREVSFVDGKLYLRPRYQRWHARSPSQPDEPIALADQFYEPIAATWDLVAPGVAVADKGTTKIAGRAGRTIAVAPAPSSRRPASEPLPQRKWRERRTINAVSGTVVLDAEHSVPLAVNLKGTIGFSRDNRQFTMQITLQSEVTNIGQPAPIAAPPASDVVATPERLREVDDRDFLLQGIAPPVRRPANSAPEKPSGSTPKEKSP